MKPFTFRNGRCYCIGLFILLLGNIQSSNAQVRMRSNLLIVDQTGATLMDGNMTNYHTTYSNTIDNYDIWKMSNFGENFGILRSSANLVIERRNYVQGSDTTFFRMWNVKQRNYRLQVIAENLHTFNLVAFVRDLYLNQDVKVDLNDTTDLDFSVTSQPGSYAQNRFMLIYMDANMASLLPVTFTSIEAIRKNADVQISWTTENESSIEQYEVEHSTDGIHFQSRHTVAPKNNSGPLAYQVADQQADQSLHYYRVKATSIGGRKQYSAIARVAANDHRDVFTVYPNPVQNNSIQLQMDVAQAGLHSFIIISSNGTEQRLGAVKLTAGPQNRSVALPTSITAGIYRLKIITPGNRILLKTLSVL